MFKINIESNTDLEYWGQEMTDADWERFEGAVRSEIEKRYPEADVNFSRSYQQFHHSNRVEVAENEIGADEESIQQILSDVFGYGF